MYTLLSAPPEQMGVPSGALQRFVEHLTEKRLCLHSVLVLRHGKLIAEGYAPPFHAGRLHRMYSVSKSFVSIAIGLLVGEGRVALDDPIASYFPEKLPPRLHPFLAGTTIRDLLRMATPFACNNYTVQDLDWVAAFFDKEPAFPGGTLFHYNTAATVVLNALVEKLSGAPSFVAYLRPRLLDPIGFSPDAWCIQRPEGGAWGGSGVLCTPRDLARFALVLLQNGRWGGRQLIPAEYVAAATAKQIDNRLHSDDPELQFGYGYQFWRVRHNGFACVGMGSQLAVCLPDQDLILVTTGDTQEIPNGNNLILEALWEDIYPHLSNGPLPENPTACRALADRLRRMELLPVEGAAASPSMRQWDGVRYDMLPNRMGLDHMTFRFGADGGTLTYGNATGAHVLSFGFGRFVCGSFPETGYFGPQIGQRPGRPYDCAAMGAWANERTLILYVYILDDYLGTLKLQAVFDGAHIAVDMEKAAEWFLEEYSGECAGRCTAGGAAE